MDLTPAELTQAQAAAPDAKRFQKATFNGRTLIFRNPTRPEYKMFEQLWDQQNGEAKACSALAGALIVIPTPAEWESDILAVYPGAGRNNEIAKALLNLTGYASEENQK